MASTWEQESNSCGQLPVQSFQEVKVCTPGSDSSALSSAPHVLFLVMLLALHV